MMKRIQDLPIRQIQRDESTQARVRTYDDVAGEYAQILEHLPEPIVFFDGRLYWLADGWHTVRAHELARKKVVRCEVRRGTRLDAIIFAAGANTKHGLRPTRADKRKAIGLLLEHCPAWSNRQIAEQCWVDHKTVASIRREMETGSGENPQTTEIEYDGGTTGSSALVDRLTDAQRAVFEAMSPQEQAQVLKECEIDALDERLAACEIVIFRIQKRLGDDEIGKAIRNELKIFQMHMRRSVGWEETKRTVIDEAFKERTLVDLDRIRKLNNGMPGERQRTPILDRLAAKIKESS